MSYRTQEILRMIIPGLYLIAMLLILIMIGGGWKDIQDNEMRVIIEELKGVSNVVVLLLPFLGFVAGYLIESIMYFGERLLYKIGLSRPSKLILSGSKIYILDNLATIKTDLGIGEEVSNHIAGEALQIAKQKIDRKDVEMFHDTSIMARNIMGSQLILAVFSACYIGLLTKAFLAMIVLLLIMSVYWYHRNCIYVKYVLSEYGKTIKNQKNKIKSQ